MNTEKAAQTRGMIRNTCGHAGGFSFSGICRLCRLKLKYANDPVFRAKRKALSAKRKYDRPAYVRERDRISRRYHERRAITMDAVFTHYGRKCVCCAEDRPDFLTIDHVNNDGAQHRKELGRKTGYNFYRWLLRNRFPPGFRVYCYNCNCGSARHQGTCPHTIEPSFRRTDIRETSHWDSLQECF